LPETSATADDAPPQHATASLARAADAARHAKLNHALRVQQLSNLASITSPFSVAMALPLHGSREQQEVYGTGSSPEDAATGWITLALHVLFTVLLNAALIGLMVWLFNVRWRVTY
jgi:hypothetical protein